MSADRDQWLHRKSAENSYPNVSASQALRYLAQAGWRDVFLKGSTRPVPTFAVGLYPRLYCRWPLPTAAGLLRRSGRCLDCGDQQPGSQTFVIKLSSYAATIRVEDRLAVLELQLY